MGVHKPDGGLTWISVNSRPLFRSDGTSLYGVMASFSDITELKRMEAELARAREQLKSNPDRGLSV
jgi:PAS domain S-box-containing protein